MVSLSDLHPNRRRAGYWSPGNYWRFLDAFNRRPLSDLENELAELTAFRPRVGIAWPQSNYFRALTRAVRENRGKVR